MMNLINNINNISNIFIIYTLFFHLQIIFSLKVVIPFHHYNSNSDSFIQNNLENSIYTELKVGTYNNNPDSKSLILFINLQKSILSITNLNICPSNSFYNKNESISFQNINGLSQDSFYFYKDIQLSKEEKFDNIVFKYQETNEKNNFCGNIGLNMINCIENEKNNLIYNLKKNNYINKYYVSFSFSEKKAFDNYENLEGEIIIGELPHEYNKDKYSENNLKQDLVTIELVKSYHFIFDKIYVGLNNKEKIILEDKDKKDESLLKVYLEISYGLISGPDLYQIYIEQNFFNKSEISNICHKTKDYGRTMDYDIYICNKDIESKFYLFPELIFYKQNHNFNFTFNYEDLFMIKNNKYYFKVIFIGGLKNWRFGLPFFLKYQLAFNQDTKQIGFYTDCITKEEDKSKINIWIWIVIPIAVLGIVVATVFISKKLFGNNNRRKKANELDDEFEYETEKKIKKENENKLFDDEEKDKN